MRVAWGWRGPAISLIEDTAPGWTGIRRTPTPSHPARRAPEHRAGPGHLPRAQGGTPGRSRARPGPALPAAPSGNPRAARRPGSASADRGHKRSKENSAEGNTRQSVPGRGSWRNLGDSEEAFLEGAEAPGAATLAYQAISKQGFGTQS